MGAQTGDHWLDEFISLWEVELPLVVISTAQTRCNGTCVQNSASQVFCNCSCNTDFMSWSVNTATSILRV
eukprot:5905043-Karenia_brevis.AAC.1